MAQQVDIIFIIWKELKGKNKMKKKIKIIEKHDPEVWQLFDAIVKAKFYLEIKEDFEMPDGRNVPSTDRTIWGLIDHYTDDPRNLEILEVYHKKLRGV